MARYVRSRRTSGYTNRYKRRGRGPSANPIKRYIGKRRNFKYGNLWRDVKMLKGLINTEIKYLDAFQQNNATENYYEIEAGPNRGTEGNATVPPTSGYYSMPIHYPTQGDDYNNRDGRSLKLKSVQWKGVMAIDTGDASSVNVAGILASGKYRAFIIVDHQAQQGETHDPVPLYFELDQNGDYSTQSRVSRQHVKRYSILTSQTIYLSTRTPKREINLFKRVNDKIRFDGVTGLDFMDKQFHCVILPPANFDVASAQDYMSRAYGQFNTRITYVDN